MTLYTKNNGYPKPIPFRIVLPSGMTRTDPATFTADEIYSAGYIEASAAPEINSSQTVHWSTDTGSWVIENKTPEQIQSELDEEMQRVRLFRNKLLSDCDWTQVADAPVDQAAWAVYRQELRDLPANTTDPYNPVWPTPPA